MFTTKELNIPPIPADLILPLDQILKLDPFVLQNPDGSVYDVPFYKVFVANATLQEWVRSQFKFEIEWVEYLVAYESLGMHTDLGRCVGINYLLDAGGENVATEFYDIDRKTLLSRTVYQTNKWYMLNVEIPHQVVGEVKSPRIILSVTPKSGVTYRPEDFI